MPKPTINPEVNKKPEQDQKPNETVALEVKAKPDAEDPEVEAAAQASQTAAEHKAEHDKAVVEKNAALKGHKVNANDVLKTVGESKDLIKAVKEDAEKRGKNFSVCPISGVLVVG